MQMEQSETTTAPELAVQLRNAVVAGNYAQAGQLAERYIQSVSAEHAAGARNLLLWAQQAVAIHRNLYADQLANLQKMSGYRTSLAQPNLQVKG